MRKFSILLAAAFVMAVAISVRWEPASFEERAMQLELEQSPARLVELLKNEPLAVQAVILDYADDDLLSLKGQAALMRYPGLAREILPLYGDRPEFREILRDYGESALLPIHYFLKHDVHSVALGHYATQKMQSVKEAAKRFFGSEKKASPSTSTEPSPHAGTAEPLTPEQRGWYAVSYIRREGHDFLGQFVVTSAGEPKWIQSERVLEGLSGFFTSGIRDLETKVQMEQAVTAGDVGWATADTLVVLGAVKLLRAGRAAAAAGQPITATTRTATLTSRLARGSGLGMRIARYGKWPAIAVAVYMAFRHPSIISDALVDIAHFLGLPTWFALFAGWTLILLPILYIASWALRLIAWSAIALLHAILRVLSWLDGNLNRRTRFEM